MSATDSFESLAAELLRRVPSVDQIAYFPPVGGAPAGADVTFTPAATDADRQLAASIVAGWDWSDAAQQARDRAAKRAAAKASLAGADPIQAASRNALRVIYASIVETRQALNPLLIAAGQPPLPIRNWKQALAAVRQQIDAEADPEG